jgi:predicted transcriptional regulator
MAALDWLPLQLAIKARRKYEPREPTSLDCLSKKNQDFIANGASEGTRNNRLFAAACDLNGNGFSHYQAQDILSPVALRCGMSQGEITDSLKSAYQKTRTPAKQPRPTPPTPFWAKARAWAESHKWERMAATVTTKSKFAKTKARVYSVSAQTARDVFLACCELARRAHTAGVFRASTREAAELADVKSDTAYRALVCLCEAGYLKRCGYSDMRAGLYAFSKELLQKGDSNLHWLLTTVPKMQQHHEAFYRGGLGKMAERIWRLTLKEAMQAAKIARRLQVNRATVGRALRRLAMFGLVTQIGRKWQGNAAGNDYLTEIAAKCGTLGKAQRRKDRHAQDRARDISQAIMGRKRKWESIHL